MSTRFFSALQAIGSLFLGVLLYFLFREQTIFHTLFHQKGIWSTVRFPSDVLIRYYFPDFLWGYSLCSALLAVYPQSNFRYLCPFPWISFGAGLAFETAQFLRLIPGTGDPVDILLYLSAAFVAYGNITHYAKRRKKQ